MKSYEWRRYYNPKMGKFIYKHKGNGLIVDDLKSLSKPKVVLPIVKKALKSTTKKIEQSGDLIMKKLANSKLSDTNKILNRLLN